MGFEEKCKNKSPNQLQNWQSAKLQKKDNTKTRQIGKFNLQKQLLRWQLVITFIPTFATFELARDHLIADKVQIRIYYVCMNMYLKTDPDVQYLL